MAHAQRGNIVSCLELRYWLGVVVISWTNLRGKIRDLGVNHMP